MNDRARSPNDPAGSVRTGEESSSAAGQSVVPVGGGEPAGIAVAVASGSEALAAPLQQINQQLASLAQAFDAKIKYDHIKDEQITRLHQEVEGYKNGLHLSLLRPIFDDLIAMYDDLGQIIGRYLDTLPENFIKSLRAFQAGILETLRRNGVEFYQEASPTYNSERQRVNQPIDTPDPAQDRLIARRVRPGFAYGGRVLRPELVDVYRSAAR